MSTTSAKVSPLRHLVNILSDAVTQIDEKYASANLEFPTFDKPFDEKNAACLLLSDPDIAPLSSVIVAAADQLIASARHPLLTVLDIVQSHSLVACLGLVCETSITEILREGGPGGLHVKDIAAKSKLHPGKLARALRLLATHHIFIEASPDVFVNNSLSSVLDTGKSTEVLFTQPKIDKFKGARTRNCALVELRADDSMKASTCLTDALVDPKTSHSDELSDSPCLRLYGAKSYFDYLFAPGNEYRGARFHAAMGSLVSSESSAVAPGGFAWETLPKGARVVDVGGGTGSACYEIMKKNPLLKFTIQDLQNAVDQAIASWNYHEPKAIADGQVTIQTHDFFSPQPIKNADVFLLRNILHDWPNAKAVEILRQLRGAAIPGKTKLVVIDAIVGYACATDQGKIQGAEGIVFEGSDKGRKVPVGLLPNLGRAGARNYHLDITMLAKFNAQERTLRDHIEVTEASGWKIQKVYSPEGTRTSHLLAEAV